MVPPSIFGRGEPTTQVHGKYHSTRKFAENKAKMCLNARLRARYRLLVNGMVGIRYGRRDRSDLNKFVGDVDIDGPVHDLVTDTGSLHLDVRVFLDRKHKGEFFKR